jgi:peptidoglycan hydrolase-like protein with peptidoglycan-binding domain
VTGSGVFATGSWTISLMQLGYWPDRMDDSSEDEQLQNAVYAFQVAETLTLTGELDAETVSRLKSSYGS